MRGGALLTMLDNVGGLCGGLAALPDGWVVSTNLSARTVRLEHVGPFRIDARVLRQGRASVVTAVEIRDEGAADALVVDGVLTSAILVPENGPPRWARPLVLEPGEPLVEPVPPIPDWLGAHAIDDATIEMPLAESLRNPWGILHGGAVASLIDLTAEHVTGGVTTDVVLHFLAPNRIGPVRAVARNAGISRRRNRAARRSARRRRRAGHRARGRDVGSGARRPGAMNGAGRAACIPGSFDPPTIAHVAIAEAAVRVGALDRLDLAISRVALGKDAAAQRPLESRVAMLERLAVSRPWLGIVVTDAQLITDIAAGYDVVVMGADKWAQVRDPAWYDGSIAARDAALARLPRVLVAPRPGFEVVGADALELPAASRLGVVVGRARAGNHHLIAPECRPDREPAHRRRQQRHREPARRLVARPRRARPGAWSRRCKSSLGRVAIASASCSTAARSPTSPKACTTACSSRTRPAPAATPPTTASSRKSGATATRRRSSWSRRTARSPSGSARSARRSKARGFAPRTGCRRQPDLLRSGNGTPVTPSSRCTRIEFNAIDTRWYCPTVNTRSSSCCSS